MGFVTPISAWFRGALADEAQGLAVSKTLSATGWFDMRAVQYLAEDHRAGKAEHGRTLWQLMMLERRSEEHTSELQSLMRISYAVFCLKKKKKKRATEDKR